MMDNEQTFNLKQVAKHVPFSVYSTLKSKAIRQPENQLPEVLFITSYPPQECGIATYSQDLLNAMNNKFNDSFSLKVCALEPGNTKYLYPKEVKFILDTNKPSAYLELSQTINQDHNIQLVLLQHEFGFFKQAGDDALLQLLYGLVKPVVIVFHTVLPHPDNDLLSHVRRIVAVCDSIIVMTKNAAHILSKDYNVPLNKIEVIAHGTHLVPHINKPLLKAKYGLTGRKVLSTFGLLGAGKSIETTLDALPDIIKENPDVMFLAIGKTHPGVLASEGEQYRETLEAKVKDLSLQKHVIFINRYLPLHDLLEYLQLTDIYLFTSKDPNQAVSGTFSYAMSCGCPIISTPIPQAKELLSPSTGIIIDFQSAQQLAEGVNRLLNDDVLCNTFSQNTLQTIVPTAWENSAIAHAQLLQKITRKVLASTTQQPVMYDNIPKMYDTAPKNDSIQLKYQLPDINLVHLKKMTTPFACLQFSIFNQPDNASGYTLDDNARALIAFCMHYQISGNNADLEYIRLYLNFIKYCQLPSGNFNNYVDFEQNFTEQNNETNLSDSNGRAIWALGFLISKKVILPADVIQLAESVLENALLHVESMYSTRAMAFSIKGLYYYNLKKKSLKISLLIEILANRLVQMYRHESELKWQWFESYMTYGNSILPEALLLAYIETGNKVYKEIAKNSFDFLLSLTLNGDKIKVISNKGWLYKGHQLVPIVVGGEQPIDVAYTILAMNLFYKTFQDASYFEKMTIAFNWFLGNNHLNQIIYNPCTGGCYDGLEENTVNLNQGAESTVSYLMARLIMEKSV